MTEVWVPITGFGDAYSVSNLGNVMRTAPRQLKHRKIDPWANFKPSDIRANTNRSGYRQVRIGVSGSQTTISIHRLVAKAFIPNPDGLKDVNHKDGDKTNNRVDNLEWISRSGNVLHAISNGLQKVLCGEAHGNSKLNTEAVKDIRTRACKPKDFAAKYGVDVTLIYLVLSRKIWKHVE